ncbi:hypothetical protein [Sneathiella litorea]|uniref:SIMPL domain-containing protein n=1 Tax=Sneathiella litorea TaxID=2606216 RepID=A0A6L8W607_9PROT|nr:hypothetical protein [Sneathiella litorea]MZR29923.1 hypothetical protein [Sneathiella litorea]
MNKLVIATIAFLSFVPLAAAEMPHKSSIMQDQVVLNLTTEGWVKTDTARVSVYFELVQQEEATDALKNRIDGSLQSLAKDVEWRITSSRQQLDQTGLNRWYVSAEARIPEAVLAGLQDRAKEASSPGYKATISNVDFTPSLAEFEKLRGDLRSQIYQQALDEVARLNKVMPGADYHVRKIDFVQLYPVQTMDAAPRTMMMKSSMAESASGSQGGAELLVSVKQSESARVILGRSAAPAVTQE